MAKGPERTAQHYGPGVTGASQSVLAELMTLLGPYRESLVLVGGWAPYFLLKQNQRPEDDFVHVGSIDIDFAVDMSRLPQEAYATITELLGERGYEPLAQRRGAGLPSSFERTARSPVTEKPYKIRVDFLTGIEAGAESKALRRTVQESLLARKVRGCEAAFKHQTVFDLEGLLPDQGLVRVAVRMADVVSCLTMKGIVLGERFREKDAYDIYAVAAHYKNGPADVAAALKPYGDDPLVQEAMRQIAGAFSSRRASGPTWAASFLISPLFAAEHERVRTDAFMVVDALVEALGLKRGAAEKIV